MGIRNEQDEQEFWYLSTTDGRGGGGGGELDRIMTLKSLTLGPGYKLMRVNGMLTTNGTN